MPAERKPAFEVPLDREGVGLHEPGTVLILGPEQERDAFAVRLVGRRHAGDVQRVERQSRGVGIRVRCGRTETSRRRLPADRESP